jgi:hypothetical protein
LIENFTFVSFLQLSLKECSDLAKTAPVNGERQSHLVEGNRDARSARLPNSTRQRLAARDSGLI